jgi:hypothetical protein
LNTCSKLPVENSVLETYNTEKEGTPITNNKNAGKIVQDISSTLE